MLTFHELYSKLPVVEEKPKPGSRYARYILLFILFCLAAAIALVFAGWYWENLTLLQTYWWPLGLMYASAAVYVYLEGREIWATMGRPEAGLLDGVDQRFAEEKALAAEVAQEDPFEIKAMKERLEVTLSLRERGLQMIQQFSIIVSVVSAVVTSDWVQAALKLPNMFKVLGPALLIFFAIIAISVYVEIIKLRRLAVVLQHATGLSEERKQKSFRKISRKRGAKLA
jgi:hypothetical protein